MPQAKFCALLKKKVRYKVVAHTSQKPKWSELIPVSGLSMKHTQVYCYSPLDGMLVHLKVTPSSMLLDSFIHLGEESQSGLKFLV